MLPDLVTFDAAAMEENRAIAAMIEQAMGEAPPVHAVPPADTRTARREGRGLWPAPVFSDEARDVHIDGPGGPLRVRVFVPEGPRALYVHIHGGGWVLGGADLADAALLELARSAEVVVASVDYRLAPEHPFPAGPDDCEAAALWAIDAASDFGVEDLLIGGESAGAHLSALTLLRLRDSGAPVERFVGANLVYGAYDLSMTPSQRLWGDRDLVLSTPTMAWFYDLFLPGLSPEERRSPHISPLYADVRGLPPALFTVGTEDPLLDDTLFMAARWRAAGNEATVMVYPEAIHGFNGFATAMARHTSAAQAAFLRERTRAVRT